MWSTNVGEGARTGGRDTSNIIYSYRFDYKQYLFVECVGTGIWECQLLGVHSCQVGESDSFRERCIEQARGIAWAAPRGNGIVIAAALCHLKGECIPERLASVPGLTLQSMVRASLAVEADQRHQPCRVTSLTVVSSVMRGLMSNGTVPLHRYPASRVLLACRTCPYKGQYAKAALIERVGPDESLVILRLKIADGWGCTIARATIAGERVPGAAQRGAYYPQSSVKNSQGFEQGRVFASSKNSCLPE